MDVTSAINSLGTDYVSKVSQAMQDSATGSTAKTDSTFDSIYNAVSGLLDSTNTYIQQAQQAEVDFALGNTLPVMVAISLLCVICHYGEKLCFKKR